MQQVYKAPSTGKIALQYDLIFGLIAAIIKTGVLLANTFAFSTAIGFSLTLAGLDFLVGLAAYFIAGILASKQTARVNTGTFSGLWAGGVYGLVGIIVSMALFFTVNLPRLNANVPDTSVSADTFRAAAVAGGVGFAIFGLLLTIGLGAGLGALGGLIGKNTSKVATGQPMPGYPPQQPYPGQPYPGQTYYADQSNPYQPYPNQGPSSPYNQ